MNMSQTEKSVVPFAPGGGTRQSRRVYSQAASQSSWRGRKNSQHALDMAQKLSHQLRAAEQRITDLEAEVERLRDRAERAEQWLHEVMRKSKNASSGTVAVHEQRRVTRRNFKFFSGGAFQPAYVPRNSELPADYRHLQSVQ